MARCRSAVSVCGAVSVRQSLQQVSGVSLADVNDHLAGRSSSRHTVPKIGFKKTSKDNKRENVLHKRRKNQRNETEMVSDEDVSTILF